jgi:acetolactate synthase-1/2/3 large subunit
MGMIRQFQEKNFAENYYLTTENSGYAAPDFEKIAHAYGLEYCRIGNHADLENKTFKFNAPVIVEVKFDSTTYLLPNYGSPLEDMTPLIERSLYDELVGL